MNKSIYESIKEAVADGKLPGNFPLPEFTDREEEFSFADAANVLP